MTFKLQSALALDSVTASTTTVISVSSDSIEKGLLHGTDNAEEKKENGLQSPITYVRLLVYSSHIRRT
jgi:hypothetical protein